MVEEARARLDAAVQAGQLSGLHGVVVLQRGLPLLAAYYRGADERMGAPLGEVVFDADVPHDLRSVTKSVVGALFGVAIREHRVDVRSRLWDVLVSRRAVFGEAAKALTLE